MKKRIYRNLYLLLLLVMSISLVACGKTGETKNLWDSAIYTADAELGTGAKTVTVTVTALEQSVVFTLHTDQENLEKALQEHQLIAGEKGPYGLYVKEVNGMVADYNVDQTYWGFSQKGVSMQTGVSGAKIVDGDAFELVYTKWDSSIDTK